MALSVEKCSSAREYKVKDLSQADFGRLELELAEVEMPGLMACRTEFGPSQPFKGARISGSLHMTIQTAVLIEIVIALAEEEFEKSGKVPDPESVDNPEFKTDASKYRKLKERLVGVSEETTTGVKRLYQMQEYDTLLFPAINVNNSVSKSKMLLHGVVKQQWSTRPGSVSFFLQLKYAAFCEDAVKLLACSSRKECT
ncbi:hypothetical protein ZWY2020_050715 [Hordeum vulgare]|nr:hypothetical protein ZWY2020_050715 [Hordeum vulgare]